MMNNTEIDRKLAEAMGYRIGKPSLDGTLRVYKSVDNKVPRYFRPTENMADAWEVFKLFNLNEIYRSLQTWVAMKYGCDEPVSVTAQSDESAAKAICLAALKIIEGSKSDE